jgi:hypothetical protein
VCLHFSCEIFSDFDQNSNVCENFSGIRQYQTLGSSRIISFKKKDLANVTGQFFVRVLQEGITESIFILMEYPFLIR